MSKNISFYAVLSQSETKICRKFLLLGETTTFPVTFKRVRLTVPPPPAIWRASSVMGRLDDIRLPTLFGRRL